MQFSIAVALWTSFVAFLGYEFGSTRMATFVVKTLADPNALWPPKVRTGMLPWAAPEYLWGNYCEICLSDEVPPAPPTCPAIAPFPPWPTTGIHGAAVEASRWSGRYHSLALEAFIVGSIVVLFVSAVVGSLLRADQTRVAAVERLVRWQSSVLDDVAAAIGADADPSRLVLAVSVTTNGLRSQVAALDADVVAAAAKVARLQLALESANDALQREQAAAAAAAAEAATAAAAAAEAEAAAEAATAAATAAAAEAAAESSATAEAAEAATSEPTMSKSQRKKADRKAAFKRRQEKEKKEKEKSKEPQQPQFPPQQ